MLGLPLAFASPWLLLGLGLLPVIWWLLRVTPPAPTRVAFPPIRLLLQLREPEETPQRSPWWLTALRLLLAALVILALAVPIWRPSTPALTGEGPLLVVLDNGWASAPDWDNRVSVAERLIDTAERAGRPVHLALTATPASDDLPPADALSAAAPQPFSPRLAPLTERLLQRISTDAIEEIAWLSDGLGGGEDALVSLREAIPGEFALWTTDAPVLGLRPATEGEEGDAVLLSSAPAEPIVRALDARSRTLAELPVSAEGAAPFDFDLPLQIRNEVAQIEIVGVASAGSIRLLDEGSRRRTVGLVSGDAVNEAQPLLSPLHYISRALLPYAEVVQPEETDVGAALDTLLAEGHGTAVVVLADVGILLPEDEERLANWIEDGGTLIRFAGPRLAAGEDTLIPVSLRRGDRSLGGTLSWEEPQPLDAFSGPLAALPVPADVRVSRQVLAEPDTDLIEKTWASLADGTPLVTAESRGQGRIVLFHVTADTRWSNLPLSGAFVDVLRRTVALANARGGAGTRETTLAPYRTLDGFGRLGAPSPTTQPLDTRRMTPGPANPPGLYGTQDGFVALNLLAEDAALTPLDLGALDGVSPPRGYDEAAPLELTPWLLTAALVLLIIDSLVVLLLRGNPFAGRAAATASGLLVVAGLSLSAPEAHAQAISDIEAAGQTRLAYVLTGDQSLDRVSEAGLRGLTLALNARTAFEPADPVGVTMGEDELAFYPLLYWPIEADAADFSEDERRSLVAYL
ncbi:MAG: BatA domain-containing protein, partial [Pseudomonadota bacterium]